jgi:hypothetical protein
MPVYNNELLLGAGYNILVSGGLCVVNTNGHTVYREPQSAGPGYFLTRGEVDTDLFPYPAGYAGIVNHMLYAIDFTGLITSSGVTASGQFFPQFYPVKWYPKITYDEPWDTGFTTSFNIDVARVAKNPLYTNLNSGRTRVYTSSQRRFDALGEENYVESFDIPKGALQRGDVLYTNGTYLIPTAEGRIGGAEGTEISRADSMVIVMRGGGVLSPQRYRSLVKYDSSGDATETVDPVTDFTGDDDYLPFTAKFSAGWRAVGARNGTSAGAPVLIVGPGQLEDLSVDYPIINAFSSAVVQTDLYYATQNGFYRVPAYGEFTSQAESLFVIPSGYEPQMVDSVMRGGIVTASVTYNSTHTRDYIVLGIAGRLGETSSYRQQIAWSVDGGLTWEYSPQFTGGLVLNGAWWIEP